MMSEAESEPEVTPDWYALAIDETHYWNIAEEDKPKIEKMVGVYIFDRASHTYCCELTPSYWLIQLRNVIYFREDAITDEERDRLESKYLHSGGVDDSSCYMHVRVVEGMPDSVKHAYGAPQDLDVEDRGEEEVREYFQGNCPF